MYRLSRSPLLWRLLSYFSSFICWHAWPGSCGRRDRGRGSRGLNGGPGTGYLERITMHRLTVFEGLFGQLISTLFKISLVWIKNGVNWLNYNYANVNK